MKIVVLNGSPKGDVSVTRQYVLYLEKAFPQHQFVVLHVAQQSRKLERDAAAFDEVIAGGSLRGRGDLGVSAVHPAGLLAVQEVHRAHR